MSEVIEFVDWGHDFRYATEKQRITAFIRAMAAERGYTHGIVQEMFIKNRYRNMFGQYLTVHLQKPDWVHVQPKRYVPVRIWFTEDCMLQDKENNPEWFPETVQML